MNELPFDVSLFILSDWLSIVELGKLDSANCNKLERENIISSDFFLMSSNEDFGGFVQSKGGSQICHDLH